MSCDTFCTGQSLLHRLDARGKIVLAMLFAVEVAVTDNLLLLLPALALSIILALTARLDSGKLTSRLLLINSFNLFLWLTLPFTAGGETLFSIGPLNATTQGIMLATLITIKANTIILALIALVATSPVFALGHAMNELRFPGKLVHLLLFTYRYLDVIQHEYSRLSKAMKVRGFVPKSNAHTYRSYAYLVGMLLVRSYERSERVYQAMLCRGFKNRFIVLKESSWHAADTLFLCGGLSLILILGVLSCIKIPL
jgi:cobalt/nickel transport system permease protein